jgi:hypothetical protein
MSGAIEWAMLLFGACKIAADKANLQETLGVAIIRHARAPVRLARLRPILWPAHFNVADIPRTSGLVHSFDANFESMYNLRFPRPWLGVSLNI